MRLMNMSPRRPRRLLAGLVLVVTAACSNGSTVATTTEPPISTSTATTSSTTSPTTTTANGGPDSDAVPMHAVPDNAQVVNNGTYSAAIDVIALGVLLRI